MIVDSALFWAFLVVFVRCSAMLLASPVFGAQNTPLQIRVFSTLAIAGALTVVIQPKIGPVPQDQYALVLTLGNEILAGLVLGMFVSIAFTAFQMAGAMLDLQVGLGASHVINPATGVPSTLLAQYKYMLATVVFFAMSGHHVLFKAFTQSYQVLPSFGTAQFGSMQGTIVDLVTNACLLALQIAAPVAAVGIIVDAAMGIVNRAVPQMQVFLVGMPAKIAMGLAALSIALPVAAASVDSGVELAVDALGRVFRTGG